MNLQDRIHTLQQWGNAISAIPVSEREALFHRANHKNGWFNPETCAQALMGILSWFEVDQLAKWAKPYDLSPVLTQKSVGLVMAGNIPLVGFHDFLSVLLSGHIAKVKLSSQDEVLLPYLADLLPRIDTRWQTQYSFEERLLAVDAVIATGSDNAARYFDYYFRHLPTIIRKNRTSVAVIVGVENAASYSLLGKDIFSFFGLGCRNVSKVYLPENFDVPVLLDALQGFQPIINHHKYANNYDYQKSIRLVAQKPFLDTGYLIVEQSAELVSPIAVLYYETYRDQQHLGDLLAANANKIQCIVSANGWYANSIAFGEAQTPTLTDYADGADVLRFLSEIR
jgi:hypothetical protein